MEKFEKSIDEAKKKRKNCVDEPQSIIAHKMYTDDEISYNQKKKMDSSRVNFQVINLFIKLFVFLLIFISRLFFERESKFGSRYFLNLFYVSFFRTLFLKYMISTTTVSPKDIQFMEKIPFQVYLHTYTYTYTYIYTYIIIF